jgi:hypothetical protein
MFLQTAVTSPMNTHTHIHTHIHIHTYTHIHNPFNVVFQVDLSGYIEKILRVGFVFPRKVRTCTMIIYVRSVESNKR